MATQSSNPFYGNQRNSSIPSDSSTRNLALDNLIRRELRVGDPNNPNEVAEALLTRYKDSPKVMSLQREAEGVAYLPPATTTLPVQATTSSDSEWQQAKDDVERDLQELMTNVILKDVTPELRGWATAIRSSMAEGLMSARFALDRIQRDKVFGIRRTLGGYARVARLVGALTPSVNVYFRKLAQSLDEVSSVLLVMMGEALANVGFGSGRFLLQVPYSELQVRRDATVYALRNLVGSAQEAYDPNEWQRGLHAYRKLFTTLDNQGQGDLRALLLESELVRIMDELIQRSEHGRVEGLRALGATAQLDLERLRRLVIIGQSIESESPPFTTFLESILLFVEAFDVAGGFRLLRISRPTILLYGLYGTSGLDSVGEDILVELCLHRNRLADQLDCFLQCDCDPLRVKGQVILDKVLYDIDRAIDLYAVGTSDKNSNSLTARSEKRAAAYGFVVNQCMEWLFSNSLADPPSSLYQLLNTVQLLLLPTANYPDENSEIAPIDDSLMQQELCLQRISEGGWINLVRTLVPGCIPLISNDGSSGVFDELQSVINRSIDLVGDHNNCPMLDVDVPDHLDRLTSYSS